MSVRSVRALAAGAAHLLCLYAARPATAAWRRAALAGMGETGLAAALMVSAEDGAAAMQRVLTAILSVLPKSGEEKAAMDVRDVCSDLRDVVSRNDPRGLVKLTAWLAARPSAAAVASEVDGD